MESYKKTLSYEENFKLWKDYELMIKNKDIIITFINNNILDLDIKSFINFYNDYKKICDIFYKDIIKFADQKGTITNYNVNFIDRTFKYDITENEVYNNDEFAINTLNLLDSYKQRVLNILK